MMLKIDYPLRRMLSLEEAAVYCQIPLSKFPHVCPVKATQLHESLKPKWDIQDLDEWINSTKGAVPVNAGDIVDRL